MAEYSKVTITVENDEEIVTMTIPIASDVKLDSHAAIIDDMFREKKEWPRFQSEIADLSLNMTAYFSDVNHHLYMIQRFVKPQMSTANQRIADGQI